MGSPAIYINAVVMDLPAASTEGQVENEYGACTISYTLDVNRIIKSVQDDRAGAIATFIGDYFTNLTVHLNVISVECTRYYSQLIQWSVR